MGSLADWFTTQIPDETWNFDNPILPLSFPSYGMMEVGLYNLGAIAIDDMLGQSASGVVKRGRRNQTLVEISCWDDGSVHADAVGKVRQMRDKVVYALLNAGRRNDAGVEILPSIKLYDYTTNPKTAMGIIQLDDADNAINEKFVSDPQSLNIKAYKLMVRVYWYELF
jgi:hypothetical protein